MARQPTRREAPAATGPDPATRRLTADERRRQLRAVALRLFATRSYETTTMEDIAAAAGVTKPILYQHFSSKRALYVELVDAVADDLLGAIGEATSAATGPRQQVEEGFAAYFQMVERHETAFRLLYRLGRPTHPELGDALRRVEDAIAEAIDPLIDAGLEREHRRLLADAMVSIAEGASRRWLGTRTEPAGTGDEAGAGGGAGAERRGAGGGADNLDPPPGALAAALEGVPERRRSDVEDLARRLADLAWAGLRAVHPD